MYVDHDWLTEHWSQGCYTAIMTPGRGSFLPPFAISPCYRSGSFAGLAGLSPVLWPALPAVVPTVLFREAVSVAWLIGAQAR